MRKQSNGRGSEEMSIRDKLLRAIEKSGLTRYAIAKGSRVDYDALVRFLDEGRDMRLSNVQKLADFFGLTLNTTRAKEPQLV
jgi:hypothetical protein